eukprot:jgi/Chlat1/3776/Chrsp259S03944
MLATACTRPAGPSHAARSQPTTSSRGRTASSGSSPWQQQPSVPPDQAAPKEAVAIVAWSGRGHAEGGGAGISWDDKHDCLVVDGLRVGAKNRPHRAFWSFGRWLYYQFFQQESSGTDLLPLQEGFFLIASNHQSHLDCGAVFVAAWEGRVHRVYALGARDYFFQNPLKALFVSHFMNVIPINRRGFSQKEVDILRLIQAKSSDQSPSAVLIFPEGTRSRDGALQRFKTGVGYLAHKLKAPVVPTYVQGTREALPKGRPLYAPTRHPLRVRFGKPLSVAPYVGEQYQKQLNTGTGTCAPAAVPVGAVAAASTADRADPSGGVASSTSSSASALADGVDARVNELNGHDPELKRKQAVRDALQVFTCDLRAAVLSLRDTLLASTWQGHSNKKTGRRRTGRLGPSLAAEAGGCSSSSSFTSVDGAFAVVAGPPVVTAFVMCLALLAAAIAASGGSPGMLGSTVSMAQAAVHSVAQACSRLIA